MAVNCDSIQVYRGLEVLSGAADAARAGAPRAPAALLRGPGRGVQRRPLRGARARGDRRPAGRGPAADRRRRHRPLPARGSGRPGPARRRSRRSCARRSSAEVAERGPEALHAELDPELAAGRRPERPQAGRPPDRAAARAGIEPARSAEGMWTAELRHPTLLVGLTMDRDELAASASTRGSTRWSRPAAAEAGARGRRARRIAHGPGGARIRAAPRGHDAAPPPEAVEAIKAAHRRYARRQLTWMRRMEGVTVLDRGAAATTPLSRRRSPTLLG